MDIKITDNFLPYEEFMEYTSNIANIPWYFSQVLPPNELHSDVDERDNFMLVHGFYRYNKIESKLYPQFIERLLPYMEVRSLYRVKMNLNPRSVKIIKHGFHTDNEFEDNITSIFYVNSNNGYTEFEDGTKCESISNRLVTFPSTIKHTGTTCTDQPFRITLNLNYF